MLSVKELIILTTSELNLTLETLPNHMGKAFHIIVKENGDNRPYQGIENVPTLLKIIPIIQKQGGLITIFDISSATFPASEQDSVSEEISPAQW